MIQAGKPDTVLPTIIVEKIVSEDDKVVIYADPPIEFTGRQIDNVYYYTSIDLPQVSAMGLVVQDVKDSIARDLFRTIAQIISADDLYLKETGRAAKYSLMRKLHRVI